MIKMNNSTSDNNPSLSICDEISLNAISHFQPFGCVVVVDKTNLHVLQCSDNIAELLKTPLNNLLNLPVTQFLSSVHEEFNVQNWLMQSDKQYERFNWLSATPIPVWVYLHHQMDFLVLEIECADSTHSERLIFSVMNELVNLKADAFSGDIQNQSMFICNEIRRITEYDRVTLYQFDPDGSGIVLGEAIKNSMDSYLGLRFPATDVPYHVRKMYLSQPIRYIPTIEYTAATLTPNQSASIDFTDLITRGVSPVHIEYLKNMGAASALSVAIIADNKLWGLISCQHQTEKYLPIHYRFGLLFFAKAISNPLISIKKEEQNIAKEKIYLALEEIQAIFKRNLDIPTGFQQAQELIMRIFSATGIVLFFNKTMLCEGKLPSERYLESIIFWLFAHDKATIFYTHELSSAIPISSSIIKDAAGILSIPLTPDEKNYLLIFRQEFVETVSWAGNPHQTVIQHENGYSPRHSFQTWSETVKGQSQEWKSYEAAAAKSLQKIFEGKQFEIMLENQALKDELTGLYNRRTMLKTLQQETTRAKRYHKQLAVLIIDIDFFKKINDEFGHAAGDTALVKISHFLQSMIRSYDYAYRYGGEEFLLIFPEITSELVLQKTQKILEGVRALQIPCQDKVLPKITVSIGIAIYPDNGIEPDELIKQADKAMYQAKAQGRDRVVRSSLLDE